PCSATERTREFALETMADDLKRMEYLPNNLYNFHPGSHVGQGAEKGIELITKQLNTVLFPEMTTTVLLETMAGKGSEVGKTFEELRSIIDGVDLDEKIGICLDTCHVFDGGYDIKDNLEEVLEEFDKIIGIDRLKAIHMNDSKNYLGCHKDRHEKIGKGAIGLEGMVKIINHKDLKDLPFFLETPNDIDGYAEEIKLLRENYNY
ncbi:MAG: deoxyribonuclease IV, partial [Ruminococcus sp.]|nr:deoxyribonuclease IV [Ruminococcus sp.]